MPPWVQIRRGSICCVLFWLVGPATAQDRLPMMTRHDRFEKVRTLIGGSVSGGSVKVEWAPDSKSFTYSKGGSRLTYDLSAGSSASGIDGHQVAPTTGRNRMAQGTRERGHQFNVAFSDDGKWKAECRSRNVFIGPADGEAKTQITTEGSVEKRIKCGMASWVYGEELDQTDAMWWSPDGVNLAYYRFDESLVPDYYLTLDETAFSNKLDVEAYPKAGDPNPVAGLCIYNRVTGATVPLDVRFESGAGSGMAEYVFSPRWSKHGDELLYFRMNRRQNTVEFCAADPKTGRCRMIFRESYPNGWVDFDPANMWSETHDGPAGRDDGAMGAEPFLWISERSGFRNLYLYDLSGKPGKQLTNNPFDAFQIIKVDMAKGLVWYTAYDGDTDYKIQLHCVSLDGHDRRLTDPAFNHTVQVAPDGGHFVDIMQSLTEPPKTVLCDADGRIIDTLATSDTAKYRALGLKTARRISFKAADGVTDLEGYIVVPSDFDETKKYPLLVKVYAAPLSGTFADTFRLPDEVTELGFVVAWFNGRGTHWRGRDFRECVYRTFGQTEIDDQAAGVKYLRTLPFIDGSRVGIFGGSYGGYAALMALLRYPDVFKAAGALAPVTDWRNYDSIYTERFMGTPQDNPKGYEASSTLNLAKNLKGDLLVYFGTADNNVHPSNAIQLAQTLSRSGKHFELMIGPDEAHSMSDLTPVWEFFVQHLVLEAEKQTALKAEQGQ